MSVTLNAFQAIEGSSCNTVMMYFFVFTEDELVMKLDNLCKGLEKHRELNWGRFLAGAVHIIKNNKTASNQIMLLHKRQQEQELREQEIIEQEMMKQEVLERYWRESGTEAEVYSMSDLCRVNEQLEAETEIIYQDKHQLTETEIIYQDKDQLTEKDPQPDIEADVSYQDTDPHDAWKHDMKLALNDCDEEDSEASSTRACSRLTYNMTPEGHATPSQVTCYTEPSSVGATAYRPPVDPMKQMLKEDASHKLDFDEALSKDPFYAGLRDKWRKKLAQHK